MSDPLLIELFEAAVRAARGADLLVGASQRSAADAWRYFGPSRSRSRCRLPQPSRGRILVTGAGKAAASLARGLETVLGDRIESGAVLVKHGHGHDRCGVFAVLEGGHPVPDAGESRGHAAVIQIVETAAETTRCSSC